MLADHQTSHSINKKGSLIGRTLYIPRMSYEGAVAMAAAYRYIGVNGQIVPESDARSLELARQYTIGEECYPEIVTLGGFLKVIESEDFDPQKTAFLMPTANGPCRFGQYRDLLEKVLRDRGNTDVMVVAPSSANGYEEIGGNAGDLVRIGWWAIVCSDAIRKLLLQFRPYEINPGDTDRIHMQSLDTICSVIENQDHSLQEKFEILRETMKNIAEAFLQTPVDFSQEKPLIGIVGEIYCRLDDFTNAELIRIVEKFGGEAWLASISEWVFYTNFMRKYDLSLQGERFSKAMLGSIIRNKVQRQDEKLLLSSLHSLFRGYEDPHNIKDFVEPARPYLPYYGSLGEMVLNVAGSIHFYHKGADGVIDISPFSCMNGIVSEAVYPRVSRDHNDVPIRTFYFDGTETDLERDVEIFLELANTYRLRKHVKR
ncbi:MAG: hypothetical protein EH225_05235, partial [Calditrichaeota bacterium]